MNEEPLQPWFRPDALGANAGFARGGRVWPPNAWEAWHALLRELRPDVPIGGDLGLVTPGSSGWAWCAGVLYRYTWDPGAWFRPGRMRVWWETPTAKGQLQ